MTRDKFSSPPVIILPLQDTAGFFSWLLYNLIHFAFVHLNLYDEVPLVPSVNRPVTSAKTMFGNRVRDATGYLYTYRCDFLIRSFS